MAAEHGLDYRNRDPGYGGRGSEKLAFQPASKGETVGVASGGHKSGRWLRGKEPLAAGRRLLALGSAAGESHLLLLIGVATHAEAAAN